MKNCIIVLCVLIFSWNANGQELDYIVHGSYGKPVLQEQLENAHTLKDINSDYPSSWISENDYISTEVRAICDGLELVASAENIHLNARQKEILKKVDIGTSIIFEVKYNTINSITKAVEEKTMNFRMSRIPQKEACFQGGDDKLKQYLKEQAIDKINEISSGDFEYASVKFYIDTDGKTMKPQLITSAGDDEVDQILLDTIKNMPEWIPAKDENGNKVVQEFEFNVGLMIGC